MDPGEAEVEAARILARERQYSTYVEWTEKLIERRAEANRFYISLCLAIVGAIGFLFTDPVDGFGSPVTVGWAIAVIAGAGLVVSFNWWSVLGSQRRVAKSKFVVIHELEKELPSKPYKGEWDKFSPTRAKVSIGAAESRLPLMFFMFFVLVLIAVLPPLTIAAAEFVEPCGLDVGCLSERALELMRASDATADPALQTGPTTPTL